MTKEERMVALVALLKAAKPYEAGVGDICDLIGCENCPYHDITDLGECEARMRKMRDTIYAIEGEVNPDA